MPLEFIFLQPESKRLRSGWRVLCFFFALSLPRLVADLFISQTVNATDTQGQSFAVDWVMIFAYAAMVAWLAVVSMAAWQWLDGSSWRAWGYQFHQGWWRDAALGSLAGALMIAGVVTLQMLSGGTRIQRNHLPLSQLMVGLVSTALLLWLAAAFEELLFRGYAFQTLLKDCPTWFPVILLAVFFGLAHWTNPSRTNFSTLNTALAGIWLSVAVLRTRSLWLATGLHFSWNWTMGAIFGLPISGLRVPHTIFQATSEAPLWITGGSYGCEGGISATVAFAMGTAWLWRNQNIQTAPATLAALTASDLAHTQTCSLHLDSTEAAP